MSGNGPRVVLGRSGVEVSPVGLGASFGIGAREMEQAFERGINYFYWGSVRTDQFGEGMSAIAQRDRDGMVVVIQTYAREPAKLRTALESGLARLPGIDHADFLLLGAWDEPPPEAIMEAAVGCKEAGLARHLMVSCHRRPTFQKHAANPHIDAMMVRYTAAQDGAARDVFPHLPEPAPGLVAYTATRWGDLMNAELTPEGERTPSAVDCYRFALSSPHVDMCLAGPANGAQLQAALEALEAPAMGEDELAWMRRVGVAVRPNAKKRMAAMAELYKDGIPYE